MQKASEIRVCMDIGSQRHQVAIGLSTGEILDEFSMTHTPKAIKELFQRIEDYRHQYNLTIVVAMEGFNGHARPIDKYVLSKGYTLLNVNNHKLAQFKKVFSLGKNDVIDTRKMFDLLKLRDHLPLAKNALQEVTLVDEVNEKLKRLTRRRRLLVSEKVRIVNRMHSDLQAICPGFSTVTGSIDNLWFLRFLTSRDDIQQLKGMHVKSLLKIKGVGKKYAVAVEQWQKTAIFSPDVDWVGKMIVSDAKRILELLVEIGELEKAIELLSEESALSNRLKSITGFGKICSAELAGEIGSIERFTSEASLALYLGMAVLDNSSGQYKGSRKTKHVNQHAKAAMMVAIARHIDNNAQSKNYYDKKRTEGKKHNQAVRALGRHMVRVIWSMVKNNRDYEERSK